MLFSYLYGYLNDRTFLDELEMSASGSVQKNFGPTHLKQILVLCPTYELVQRHEEIVGSLFWRVIENRAENDRLTVHRDTLLPKLVSGEWRVGEIVP